MPAEATGRRTEQDVIGSLTADQKKFLKRVLEIERSKLHLQPDELPDELLAAVKEIIP